MCDKVFLRTINQSPQDTALYAIRYLVLREVRFVMGGLEGVVVVVRWADEEDILSVFFSIKTASKGWRVQLE